MDIRRKPGPRPTHISERLIRHSEWRNGCLEWTGSKDELGYGRVGRGGQGRGWIYAHVAAWVLFNGPVPDGLELDHLCRNPGCCNPYHLEPVSHRENCLRGQSPPARNAKKTHCVHGHEFTPENTRIKRSGKRDCRACDREAHRRRAAQWI